MDGEDARLFKKPRLVKELHFTTLKLHTRLIIYDYLLFNIAEVAKWIGLFPPMTFFLSHSYARMTVLASIVGDLEALQYLSKIPANICTPQKYGCNVSMECICYLLASHGHWNALQWAISENYPHKHYTLTGAVEGGANIDMLQLLSSQGCEGNQFAFKLSAERGDWILMKFLHQIQCPWDSRTFAAAVSKCELDVLRWLKTYKCPWNADVFNVAVDRGDFKVLVWLQMEGFPWKSSVFNYAMREGNDFFTLQWFLHQDNSLMDDNTFNVAIQRGDIEILQYLRTKKCKMTAYNFMYAIKHKVTMDVLEWMYEAKFPWDALVFHSAIKRGDMDILKWLREKKCPWNSQCYKIAVDNERLDIVQWLHEEKCPRDEETTNLVIDEFMYLCEQQKAALDFVHPRLRQSVLSWYDRSHELTFAGQSLLPEDPAELEDYTTLLLSELALDLEDSHQLWARQPPITQDIRKFFLPR
jgi:hypothetical protein